MGLGDAFHAMTPFLGLVYTTGFEDIVELQNLNRKRKSRLEHILLAPKEPD